jgi:hypothetical protein
LPGKHQFPGDFNSTEDYALDEDPFIVSPKPNSLGKLYEVIRNEDDTDGQEVCIARVITFPQKQTQIDNNVQTMMQEGHHLNKLGCRGLL